MVPGAGRTHYDMTITSKLTDNEQLLARIAKLRAALVKIEDQDTYIHDAEETARAALDADEPSLESAAARVVKAYYATVNDGAYVSTVSLEELYAACRALAAALGAKP